MERQMTEAVTITNGDPAIEAMYPGHLLPASPQMLEELLWRSLELELSLNTGRLTALRVAA
jgi:hypothetical protein